MSTEHVEDLLSAYLDNALTQEEWLTVALHLQTCDKCNSVLEDFRRFDELLSTQPRMIPGTTLRERVFAAPDYLDFFEDSSEDYSLNDGPITDALSNFDSKLQKCVSSSDTEGMQSVPPSTKKQHAVHSLQETKAFAQISQRRHMHMQHSMYVVIATCMLLTLGVSGLIGWSAWNGWNGWQARDKTTSNAQGIVPPQSPQQGGPFPAGMRFVYLSNGALWSSPEDNSTQPARLTPSTVTVAPHWTVNPPSAHHAAGSLLAYIDMSQDCVHIIRTDGQNDTLIKQHMLSNSTTNAWNSASGNTVLNNLSWSPDGETLAFVSFSSANGTTGTAGTSSTLYLYSTITNMLQAVNVPTKGSIANLVWSPNGARIAFTQTSDSTTNILDYNILTKHTLVVTSINSSQNSSQYPLDNVLSLDWSPLSSLPAITWSIGSTGSTGTLSATKTTGHVDEVALRYVGVEMSGVQVLAKGDYTQALYSRTGDFGNGGWLLTNTSAENEDALFSLSLSGAFSTIASGNLIERATWTPDGRQVTYLDMLPSQPGTFHSVDMTSGVNTLRAQAVNDTPEPVVSPDDQSLLYSSASSDGHGAHTAVTNTQNHTTHLSLSGTASAFLWSTTSPHMAIVTLQDEAHGTHGTHGIYLVDTQSNTAQLVSTQLVVGSPLWTQVS